MIEIANWRGDVQMDIPLLIGLPGSKWMAGKNRNIEYDSYDSGPPRISRPGYIPSQSPSPSGRASGGKPWLKTFCVFAVAIFIIWLFGLPLLFLRSYSGTPGNRPIGLVCVLPTHLPDTMNLELIQYDDQSYILSDRVYKLLHGNEWRIQGEIINPLVNIPGLSSPYEFTTLQSGDQSTNEISKTINLINSNNNFLQEKYFQGVEASRLTSPLLYAININSNFRPVDKGLTAYDVFLSQKGFSVEQAPESAVKSCTFYDSAVPAP
jgi:hypothetical protein